MGLFDKFPYTNFHELNLDWIIGKIKTVETSKDEAVASAAAAKQSEDNATASEQQAADSQSAAAGSASAAADSAAGIEAAREQIYLNTQRLNNLIVDGQQTAGNTELLDIRVGYDGTIYDTAGNAVRDQVSDLNQATNSINALAISKLEAKNPQTVSGTGYYLSVGSALNISKAYRITINVQTAGTFTIQAGTGGYSAAMVDTLLSNHVFEANTPVYVLYQPTTENIKYFRISSADTSWAISVAELIDVSDAIGSLENEIDAVDSKVDNKSFDYPVKTFASITDNYTDVSDLPNQEYVVAITTRHDCTPIIGMYSETSGTTRVVDFVTNEPLPAGTHEYKFMKTASMNYFRFYVASGTVLDVGVSVVFKKNNAVTFEEIKEDIAELNDHITELNLSVFDASVLDLGVLRYIYTDIRNLPNQEYVLSISNKNQCTPVISLTSSVEASSTVQILSNGLVLLPGTHKYKFTKTQNMNYLRFYVSGNISDANASAVFYEYNIESLSRVAYANRYEGYTSSDEMRRRNEYVYKGESARWYGVQWVEGVAGVTLINSEGDSSLHDQLPIQNKMRRCIVKNGAVAYYLDENNSEKKEDGVTASILDGTDGDVCVEIPPFFFKFEEAEVNGDRQITLKISEQGLPGFVFSPRMYVGAYEATVDRDKNILASVCTSLFSYTDENVKITSIANGNYIADENGESLGTCKTAVKTGFTTNAVQFRGGDNNPTYDDVTDVSDPHYWFNNLGIPVAKHSRNDFREMEDVKNAKLMYTYNAHRALWILSIVEIPYHNIQDSVHGLGIGATVWPSYDAFKQWRIDTTESVLPCGITNALGNKSGTVYFKVQNAPVSVSGSYPNADPSTFVMADVWVPVVSYRGVENYWGHIYKTLDQITVHVVDTGVRRPEDNYKYSDVSYYYQRNPYFTDDGMNPSELVRKINFVAEISDTSKYVFGMDGHILPAGTVPGNQYQSEETYCDCTEFSSQYDDLQIDVNGSLVNGYLPGRNMMVAVFPSNGSEIRNSNGTRIVISPMK